MWRWSALVLLLITMPVVALDVTVMSYNILSPRYLKCGNYHKLPTDVIDTKLRSTRIAKVILAKDPDIVALQEVETETLKIIMNNLGDQYVAIKSRVSGKAKDFLATLYKKNKFTLAETRVVTYPVGSKSYLATKLAISKEQSLWVINTKAKWDKETLEAQKHIGALQIKYLAREIATKYIHPLIVCGDLNVVPDSDYLKPLLEKLTDPYAGYTYPTITIAEVAKRIDYILHSKNIVATPVHLAKNNIDPRLSLDNPSDHVPVLALVKL